MDGNIAGKYYRLALYKAKQRDLSGAVFYARRAMLLDRENGNARRLLNICLHELGEPCGLEYAAMFPEEAEYEKETGEKIRMARDLAEAGKLRKAEAVLRSIKHQNVRILSIRGCMKAAGGKYMSAAGLYARVLKKDTGNRAAQEYLAEVAGRGNTLF